MLDGAGVGLAIWMIAGWCLITLYKAELPERLTLADTYLFLCAAFALLIPSAMVAWFTCTLIAIWCFYRCSSNLIARSALLIFAAMAIRTPAITLLLSVLSEEFLYIDAQLVTTALTISSIETQQIGNIIVGDDGHKLAVMTGCSSFTNLSIALLVWFAISRGIRHRISGRALAAGLAITISIIGLNAFRLSLMALNPELYHFFHGDIGKDLFELALVLTTLSVALLGTGGIDENTICRHQRSSIHSG